MKSFDPLVHVEKSELILDDGQWPNFHDAEVHDLNIWRGDVRPQDNVWIGPVVEVSFELCALQFPYIVVLRFHDCEAITLQAFDHQNVVYDLAFEFEDRGLLNDGSPMLPYICVTFEQAFGVALAFKCFRVEALQRRQRDVAGVTAMLSGLAPRLLVDEYVFCTVPDFDAGFSADLDVVATFREPEGMTLVVERRSAEAAGYADASVFRCITLGLNSSLEAVGLTAAVAQALAARGISANVIAAYHHDHVFVPTARAQEALELLQAL